MPHGHHPFGVEGEGEEGRMGSNIVPFLNKMPRHFTAIDCTSFEASSSCLRTA